MTQELKTMADYVETNLAKKFRAQKLYTNCTSAIRRLNILVVKIRRARLIPLTRTVGQELLINLVLGMENEKRKKISQKNTLPPTKIHSV